MTLSPDWEAAFAESLAGPPDERQLAMAPGKLQDFVKRLNEVYERASAGGELPVVLSSGAIRAHVRAIVERVRPGTAVLSQLEIFPRARGSGRWGRCERRGSSPYAQDVTRPASPLSL